MQKICNQYPSMKHGRLKYSSTKFNEIYISLQKSPSMYTDQKINTDNNNDTPKNMAKTLALNIVIQHAQKTT